MAKFWMKNPIALLSIFSSTREEIQSENIGKQKKKDHNNLMPLQPLKKNLKPEITSKSRHLPQAVFSILSKKIPNVSQTNFQGNIKRNFNKIAMRTE